MFKMSKNKLRIAKKVVNSKKQSERESTTNVKTPNKSEGRFVTNLSDSSLIIASHHTAFISMKSRV